MFLQKLSIANFKNYKKQEFTFTGKINCFIGNNGAGKTNILDAIFYLSFCKSYFNYIDMQNILHDAPFFAVHGSYLTNGSTPDQISIIQKRNAKKVVKLNDKEYDRFSDHIGKYPLVMISPYDRDLINEGSEARRKYIDSVISQFDKIYLDDLINYNKALLQRNILLKQFSEQHYYDKDMLEIWDSKLIHLGEKIHAKRKEFIANFISLFQQYFDYISNGKEKVDIYYESQLNERGLDELLSVSVEKDRQIRYTSCGIHKDDLVFNIEGHPVKKFGSQGQQKSYVIAIKLAQFDYTREIKNFKPILLLDDIFDKLDEERVRQIIHLVADNSFGQTFITDTQHDRIKNIFKQVDIEHKIFIISEGSGTEIP
ncbi:MAG: DNA replication/repair protein RecF [Bacteroidales bacterium]|nr:DNA replication/repair protein RecF [Bacteroidales bacterium]MCF8405071.1 DNA replication/repair protein RecF [Bacteroidales bacterium]